MSKNSKLVMLAGIVLLVVVVGVAAAAKKGTKTTEVRIEKVTSRDLVASVTASGQVRPHTKVDVAADISGRIVRLAVKEGQVVTRGQFLLQIDPAIYEAAVQRSEAALAAAKAQEAQSRANLVQAKHTYERSAEIQKSNPQLLSAEQLEQLRTQVDVNQALLDAARHNVDQSLASLHDAQSQLDKTTIVAPMGGKITRLAVEQGETAVPGTFNKDAATLLTISDMSMLETRVKVDETDVSHIQLGDSAEVQLDAFPDTTFRGRVIEISNSSVKSSAVAATADQAVDYEVTIQLLNPPVDTRPDFSATARIVTDSRRNVLSVPIIALTVRENEKVPNGDTAVGLGKSAPTKQVGKKDVEGVFVIGGDNKVSFRPVRVGIAGDRYFEVVSGLRPGERIVAGTYQAIRELKDGAQVREAKVDAQDRAPVKS